MVDEPLAAQSDPSLLDLQLRAVTRYTAQNKTLVWILGLSELYKSVNLLAGTGCGLSENGQERQTYTWNRIHVCVIFSLSLGHWTEKEY